MCLWTSSSRNFFKSGAFVRLPFYLLMKELKGEYVSEDDAVGWIYVERLSFWVGGTTRCGISYCVSSGGEMRYNVLFPYCHVILIWNLDWRRRGPFRFLYRGKIVLLGHTSQYRTHPIAINRWMRVDILVLDVADILIPRTDLSKLVPWDLAVIIQGCHTCLHVSIFLRHQKAYKPERSEWSVRT